MTSFHATVFDSIYDNKTHKTIVKRNWKQFAEFFAELEKIKFTKKTAPLISPAVYEPNTTRANKNVFAWGGWTCFDVDNKKFESQQEIIDYMSSNWQNISYICYSTASCKKNHLKFRIVFPLTTWIEGATDIQLFWMIMNKRLVGLVDQQTKDRARMFYVPATYTEAEMKFFWIQNEKNMLDPYKIIEDCGEANEYRAMMNNTVSDSNSFIDALPDVMKSEVLNYRKRQLEQNGKLYVWSSYTDCPFVRENAVQEYRQIAVFGTSGRFRAFYSLMVDIIQQAVNKEYPITEQEVHQLILEIDDSIDGYYRSNGRKLSGEIRNALSFVYKSSGNFSTKKQPIVKYQPDVSLDAFLQRTQHNNPIFAEFR